MSQSLQEKVLEYLQSHHVMTLATNGPLGLWAAAVFYANDGFRLYFLSLPSSRHGTNLHANPHAAATIQEDYKDWKAIKGIQLQGEARRIQGRLKVAAVTQYARKFPIISASRAPREIAAALSRVAWFELVPSRLYFVDNELGLGHRDEVPLP